MHFTDFILAEFYVLLYLHVSTALYWWEGVLWDSYSKGLINTSFLRRNFAEGLFKMEEAQSQDSSKQRGHDSDSGIHAVRY